MRVRWQAAVKIDGDYLDARNNVGAAQTQLLVSLALFSSLLLSLLLSLALSWSLLVSLGLSWSARDCPSFRVSVCLSACVCVCVYLCVRVYCGGSLCGDAFDATAATAEPCVPMPPTHCVVKAPTVMPRGLGRMARQGCIACLVCMPQLDSCCLVGMPQLHCALPQQPCLYATTKQGLCYTTKQRACHNRLASGVACISLLARAHAGVCQPHTRICTYTRALPHTRTRVCVCMCV